MMGQLLVNTLPDQKVPYLIRSGEGERYLFGKQLATVIANSKSTEGLLEIVSLSGGKGDTFPTHKHEETHEAIFVLRGKLEVTISEKSYLLTEGNYAYIPAGVFHSYVMRSHHTQFLSATSKGNVARFYSEIGTPYELFVHPPEGDAEPTNEQFAAAAEGSDMEFDFNRVANGEAVLVENDVIPEDVSPYVLETSEGDRQVIENEVHAIMTTQANTNGEFICVISEGPKGNKIPEHYHEKHTEFFFIVDGQATLWANGEEVTVYPGDFLQVPANTKHSYRMDSHYTKFIGFLAPGLFEPFFRILGDSYAPHIFPKDPPPFRFDRVLANLDKLDLVPLGGPPNQDGAQPVKEGQKS